MLTLPIAAALASCTSKADAVKSRYDFLKANHGTLGDICAAGKDLARVYSEAGDAENYKLAEATSGTDCLTAQMDDPESRYGEKPLTEEEPDNMAAISDDTDDTKAGKGR